MEFWEFMALAIGATGLIFLIIAVTKRCEECGSLNHAFNSDKSADLTTGEAFVICKKCGSKKHKGTVYSDGTVMWFSGGTGKFDKDGDYQADAGVDGGDGGGGGGGE